MCKSFYTKVSVIVLAITMSMMFSSCSKDDDNDGNFLLGTWKMYSTGHETQDGTVNDSWTDSYIGMITFKSDGNVKIENDEENLNFSYKIDGNVVTIIDEVSLTIQERTSDKIVFKEVVETEVYGGHTYVYHEQLILKKVK